MCCGRVTALSLRYAIRDFARVSIAFLRIRIVGSDGRSSWKEVAILSRRKFDRHSDHGVSHFGEETDHRFSRYVDFFFCLHVADISDKSISVKMQTRLSRISTCIDGESRAHSRVNYLIPTCICERAVQRVAQLRARFVRSTFTKKLLSLRAKLMQS